MAYIFYIKLRFICGHTEIIKAESAYNDEELVKREIAFMAMAPCEACALKLEQISQNN